MKRSIVTVVRGLFLVPIPEKPIPHLLEKKRLSLYIASFHSEFHRTTITMDHFSFLPIFFLNSRMASNVGLPVAW